MRWWMIAIATLTMAAPVQAQGWIDPVRPSPAFGVHKVRTAVMVHVNGRVASVEVEELFRNDGPALGQADYFYPLPGEAVFSNFSLFQGDQELRGETMEADRARSIYEEIVRRKRDPALIELAGHGLLRARVFPIASGETRKITLRYTQLLGRAGDALQFKYAAGTRNASATFSLTLDDATQFGTPFSPTHEVRVQRVGNRVTVKPESELSGDFDVFIPVRSTDVGLTVVSHRPASEPGFFMLTLSPGKVAERAVPRDITAVLDVSGSMSGEKMQQARAALHALMHTLAPQDRFRLIAFSDQVRLYQREWIAASAQAVREAESWIDNLQAGGGTNIAGALDEAFGAQSSGERLPFVIFITDGLPSIGEQNPERLAKRAETRRGRNRVFAFGVGYDVNTYLLDRLSSAARGATQYVKPGEDVERPISTLAARIRFPVLTDLRIADAPAQIDEIYPIDLPDLFADDELIIVGRYRGAGRGSLSVAGTRAGRAQRFATHAEFADHELGNDFIPRIWAARKVGYLSQQLRLNGSNKEILDDLRETALRYGILSEYTSYLVQEPMLAMERNQLMSPPPMAATGQAAVVAAEAGRARREAKTAAAVDQASAANIPSQNRADVRAVGGRIFRESNGVWTDALQQPSANTVTIEPYSDAYFALLRALPELQPYWKMLPSSLVTGKTIRIKVASGGQTQLSAARIAEITKLFRT